MKIVDLDSRFPKCPRTHFYHTWACRFEDMKLGMHSWISSHFVKNSRAKLITLSCNLTFQAMLLLNLHIIRYLHKFVMYYTNIWGFIHLVIPFLDEIAKSSISIFINITLITKSTSWAPKLVSSEHKQSQNQKKQV